MRTMMMGHLRAVGISQETVNSLDREWRALRTSDATPLLAVMRYAKLGRVRVPTILYTVREGVLCGLERAAR